jgi:hypothetical protein
MLQCQDNYGVHVTLGVKGRRDNEV